MDTTKTMQKSLVDTKSPFDFTLDVELMDNQLLLIKKKRGWRKQKEAGNYI